MMGMPAQEGNILVWIRHLLQWMKAFDYVQKGIHIGNIKRIVHESIEEASKCTRCQGIHCIYQCIGNCA
jgi:hypothetical protein